ncbi:glycerophosphoryl diester phosphodiesterase membrane domain-containing protein [Psychroserpens mesophilus]|uniref:glycerophosphoryl diester phosphodiesterase membrane domain-containing protein n=1 Tax=Psychroserpens mesophilus TaxID=325473 RepID=UPI0005913D70|nr:glycerophosphoryl diester phosphodiesterase membrane domain-containing protein [Psychroserpens mesophilus]
MKSFIELKKQREFGELLADTFAFIRNEFKPFFGALINISGPYVALFLFAMVFYMYIVGDQFNFDLIQSNQFYSSPLKLISAYGLYFGTAILAYTFTTSTVLHYIKSYVKHKGIVNVEEVKRDVYKYLWRFLGLSILKGLTIFISFLICCLPVFYFVVPMVVVLPILVFEEIGASDAYAKSFPLIKDEFWITLATILVFLIIYWVVSSVFAIPTIIYTYAKMGIFSGEIDPGSLDTFVDPVYIFLNVLSQFFQYILNVITIVGSAFIYFNLNERKYFSGTLERINSLGKSEE